MAVGDCEGHVVDVIAAARCEKAVINDAEIHSFPKSVEGTVEIAGLNIHGRHALDNQLSHKQI